MTAVLITGEANVTTKLAPDYADDKVSVKVVKIIQSYAKIINRVTWGKE